MEGIVSTILQEVLEEMQSRRDNKVQLAQEVLVQYIQDHRDKEAYHQVDREVASLAKAWDQMLLHLEKWTEKAKEIEGRCENFYGE